WVIDDHSQWDKPGTQENAQTKQVDWEGKLVSAAKTAQSKNAGNLPAFIERLVGKITKPQKDWRILLAEFIQPVTDDYSFSPPDRRFQSFDFFLPDFNDTSEKVEDIWFYIDTSGSMSEDEITLCYSEIVGAINQFKGRLSGKLCFFDYDIYGPHDFNSVNNVLKIKPKGGGGTSFNIIFEHVKEQNKNNDVAGIVILTDGYASFPDEKLSDNIPTLWIVNNEDVVPPWGLHTTISV
ncbi:MAG: VWA-like domain-containing protein, partial [bacterium]